MLSIWGDVEKESGRNIIKMILIPHLFYLELQVKLLQKTLKEAPLPSDWIRSLFCVPFPRVKNINKTSVLHPSYTNIFAPC